jgi:hypothetical protein
MINHNCAGIAIMAGMYFGGKIDDEIIALGDKYDFPIVSIDNSVRWSDIIKEFYCFDRPGHGNADTEVPDIYAILSDVQNFHSHKNMPRLCESLSQNLDTPIIIISTDTFFAPEINFPEEIKRKILTKIYDVRSKGDLPRNTAISIPLGGSLSVLCSFGEGSTIVATVMNSENFNRNSIALLRGIMRFVATSIDEIIFSRMNLSNPDMINSELEYYCFYISKDNIGKAVAELTSYCFVFDINTIFNYALCLIEKEKVSSKNIFKEYGKIIETIDPRCFIFTEMSFDLDRIREFSKVLISQISHMHFLDGIFTLGEISILSLLNIAPYSFKKAIADFNAKILDYQENPLFLDTLRLFIALKSITKVSSLLRLHPNTVKYRILKVIKSPSLDTTNITVDIWNLDLLVPLENFKLENIVRIPMEIA